MNQYELDSRSGSFYFCVSILLILININIMKKLFFFALMMLAFAGCYDDTALWDQIKDHEARILKLETLCNQMNTNIASIQTIVNALQDKDYVTNVAPIKENGKETGYTITFSKSGSVTIYHGQDGKDGANGQDGQDGKDGKDGYTPVIGVKQDGDGAYYWTVDGNWLTDAAGNRIPTTGKDGADGTDGKDGANGTDGKDGADGADGNDGQDGADGVTPQLKIEESYWYISYNNGQTWDMLGKAVGEDGKDGAAGADGKDGDSFFKSVTQDDDNIYITLADGTEFTLPKVKPESVIIALNKVYEDFVVFKGEVPNLSVDFSATVYYSMNKDLTLHKYENKASVTELSNNSFTILIDGLKRDVKYYYFTEVRYNGSVIYSEVSTFVIGGYLDEYGICHGAGIKIGETIWAPVNCGYHASDFKYGKLYQWGRKYGQGYSESYGEVSPSISNERVSLEVGQRLSSADVFFQTQYDWLDEENNLLWNAGTDSDPVKTEYDPCPDGWRVPSVKELDSLESCSSLVTNEDGQNGVWFKDYHSVSEAFNKVIFLPASGMRLFSNGESCLRNERGYYWSSAPPGYYSVNVLSLGERGGGMYSGERRSNAYSVRCVRDNKAPVEIVSIKIAPTSLNLNVNESSLLSVVIIPAGAVDCEIVWSSSDHSVASVDQTGKVVAIKAGTTTITAMAGNMTAKCEVVVEYYADYIDEYGVNYGRGIKIGNTTWAPVNCGYHPSDYQYGKLYQWGRKYGQGYSSDIYDLDLHYIGKYSDAILPTVVEGGVSIATGNNQNNSNVYYRGISEYNSDWVYPQDNKLWNSGTESNPVKTEYDPCPVGWRIPTFSELDELTINYSDFIAEKSGQNGRWFSGAADFDANADQIFLPAAGNIYYNQGDFYYRSRYGYYWSSTANTCYSYMICFSNKSNLDKGSVSRANGYSVRCVQE